MAIIHFFSVDVLTASIFHVEYHWGMPDTNQTVFYDFQSRRRLDHVIEATSGCVLSI
jgi:hypothetical protein